MSDGPFAGRASNPSVLSLSRAQYGAIAGAGVLAAIWLALPTHPWVLLVAVPLGTATALGADGRSLADRVAIALSYGGRSRWTYVTLVAAGGHWRVTARGRATCVPGLVEHVGRWDLSGRDGEVAADLAAMLDQVAHEDGSRHVSWHLLGSLDPPVTILCAPPDAVVPRVVGTVPDGLSDAALAGCDNDGWLFERWRYVRSTSGVAAVFAVRSVASGAARGPLGHLAPVGSGRTLSVHVRVSSARAARAAAGRHAHRLRADLALAAVAGFRRRAGAETATAALEARERDVAAGHALARAAILVTVCARSPRALERAVASLRADARRSGAVLERGNGRHSEWLCASLPGSPAWRS